MYPRYMRVFRILALQRHATLASDISCWEIVECTWICILLQLSLKSSLYLHPPSPFIFFCFSFLPYL